MSDLDLLAQEVLDHPLVLPELVREYTGRMSHRRKTARAGLSMLEGMGIDLDAPGSYSPVVELHRKCLQPDFQHAIRMETRAALLNRLMAVTAPVIRAGELARLPEFATNAMEAEAVHDIMSHAIRSIASVIVEEKMSPYLSVDSQREFIGGCPVLSDLERQLFEAEERAVANRVLEILESSRG